MEGLHSWGVSLADTQEAKSLLSLRRLQSGPEGWQQLNQGTWYLREVWYYVSKVQMTHQFHLQGIYSKGIIRHKYNDNF